MDSPTFTLNDFRRQKQNPLKPHPSKVLNEDEEFLKPVSAALKALVGKFFRCTTHDLKKSDVTSPYGISSILALMKTGTAGTTKTELKELCGFPTCPYVLSKGFSGLTEHLLQTSEDAQIVLANAAFAAEGYKFSDGFTEYYAAPYAATLRNINFLQPGNTAAAADIDHWISEVTGRQVAAVASTEDIDLKTRLVFVNVVTFKGQWARGFSTYDTLEKPFHVSPEKTIKVPFMSATYKFPIADLPHLGAKAIGLFYKGRRLILMIIVPNRIDGLRELLKKLDANFYGSIRAKLRVSGTVALELPKWKVTSKLELKPILQNMGVKSLFNNTADLTGMFDKAEGIYVSDVIQKTVFEITEDGDEPPRDESEDPASACVPKDMPTAKFPIKDDPIPIKVNHPFLYYVYDDKFGTVLCSGTQSFI